MLLPVNSRLVIGDATISLGLTRTVASPQERRLHEVLLQDPRRLRSDRLRGIDGEKLSGISKAPSRLEL